MKGKQGQSGNKNNKQSGSVCNLEVTGHEFKEKTKDARVAS